MMNRASPRKAKATADVTHKRLALPKLTPSRMVGLIACIVALTITFAGDIRRAFRSVKADSTLRKRQRIRRN